MREGDTLKVARLDRLSCSVLHLVALGADMFGVPRSTVHGHLDKTKTVPRQPRKTALTKS
ncbi:hypothetical protein AB0K71_08920 [Streptomyces syringium]|uniref:hypothetical protein n=1 Tax=Streptomyces syringium TaxID=76729 RepID=UPI0033ADF71C